MIDGNHRTQTRKTISMADTPDPKRDWSDHEIGETWEEKDENGDVVKIITRIGISTYSCKDPIMEANSIENTRFKNCLHEPCNCRFSPKPIDLKMDKKVGMCLDCVTEHETSLKIQGKFKEYEKMKMLNNALSFFNDADIEIQTIAKTITDGVNYVDSDGGTEKWTANNENEEAIASSILDEYNKYKKDILDSFEKKETV